MTDTYAAGDFQPVPSNQEHLPVAREPDAAEQRSAPRGEPALRAAALALGLGVIWGALSAWRRRRPGDLW